MKLLLEVITCIIAAAFTEMYVRALLERRTRRRKDARAVADRLHRAIHALEEQERRYGGLY